MANNEKRKKSLPERIKEGLRDLADEWRQAIEDLVPSPEPVRVPVRIPVRIPNRTRSRGYR